LDVASTGESSAGISGVTGAAWVPGPARVAHKQIPPVLGNVSERRF